MRARSTLDWLQFKIFNVFSYFKLVFFQLQLVKTSCTLIVI